MTKQAMQRLERREDLRSADDAKFATRHARRRFAKDRKAQVSTTAHGFRVWARKTYSPQAVRGKLLAIVGAR